MLQASFPGGSADDFDAAFQDVFRFVDDDIRFAAAEQPAEQLLKVTADRFQRRRGTVAGCRC